MYNGEVYGYFSNSVFAVFYRIISSFCSCFQRFLVCIRLPHNTHYLKNGQQSINVLRARKSGMPRNMLLIYKSDRRQNRFF